MCTITTLPRVCSQNARVLSGTGFLKVHTGGFECTHGGVLNLHTGVSRAVSVPSISILSCVTLSFSLCSSLFLSLFARLSYFFCLFSALSVSVLNDDDNDRSFSLLSLYTRPRLALRARVPCASAHSLSGEHASCKKQLSRYYPCASLVPLGMK